MQDSKQSYRQILKATSLFGGVQVFTVVMAIIRLKFAAIFIGATGIGILGLLNTTIEIISGITRLGLDISAVKEISSAKETHKINRIIKSLNKVIWLTGLFGAVITLILSPWLSQLIFGDSSQTMSFVFLSIAILFNQLTTGNYAVLQGLRQLRKLAKSTLLGSFSSLLIVIPLYYFYGIKGIVPAIILTSFFTYVFSKYFTKHIDSTQAKVPLKEALFEGKEMIKLGFALSLGGLTTILTTYLIQLFISNEGGVTEVGLYTAAFMILNAYVGVIFTAMSKDYFPRLSSVIKEPKTFKRVVNQQAYVAILLLSPVIVIFLSFIPLIIKILFTKELIPMSGLLVYGILAMIFKAVSWSLGYIIIAKGNSKLFVITEVSFNILLLILCVIGYKYHGLTGVGISYLIYYVIYLFGVGLITHYKYKFRLKISIKR